MNDGKRMLLQLIRSVTRYDWKRLLPSRMEKRKIGWALSELAHPIETFRDIKYENHGSLMLANVFCLLFFALTALEYNEKAFIFNYNQQKDFNLFTTLLSSSLLLLLWTIANWAVCSLLDGEGTFKEIWIITCYSILPRLLMGYPLLLLTHALTLEESGLYRTLSSVSVIWCAILLILGMMVAHQYTVRKTVASLLLTLAGLGVMFFVAVLLFSMGQQLVSFFQTLLAEIRYRS